MQSGLFQPKPGLAGRKLREAAEAAVRDVLALRASERVLVITEADPERSSVAAALHDAAVTRGAETMLVVQPARSEDEAADRGVLRLLETEPDVLMILTAGRLGADPERIARPLHGKYQHMLHYLVAEGRSRAFWATGLPRAAFERMVPVDYASMRRRAAELVADLGDAVEVRVRSAAGTDLAIPIEASSAYREDGDLRDPGRGGELPAGAVRWAVGAGANGRVVADGSLTLPGMVASLKVPLHLRVEEGRVTQVEGPLAESVLAAFRTAGPLAERAVENGRLTRDAARVYAGNVRRVTELGLGLNPGSRVSGVPLADAKADGTLHLVVGAGSRETPPGAPISMQVVVRAPSVVAVRPDGTEASLLQGGSWSKVARVAAKAA